MNRWPMVPLTQVLRLQRRWIKPHPTAMYKEIGIRSFGNGIFHKTPVEGSILANKRVLRVEPGDLVFNNVFAWEGAVAVAGPEEAGMIGSHRFVTYTVNLDKSTAQFLKLFFTTKPGLEILMKASPGSAGRNKTLGLDRFIAQSIPLPPLVEQQRLVERIDALAAKITETKRLRNEADQARQLLFHRAAAAVFQTDRWPYYPLGNLLAEDSRNGLGTRPSDAPPGVPILRISAGTSRSDAIVDETDHKYLSISEKELEIYQLRQGDLLACRFNGNLHYVGRFSIYLNQQKQA